MFHTAAHAEEKGKVTGRCWAVGVSPVGVSPVGMSPSGRVPQWACPQWDCQPAADLEGSTENFNHKGP